MSIEWYIDKRSTAPIKPLHLHLKLLNFEINCIFHQITIQTAAGFHERNFNHHHFLVVIHSYLCGEKKKPSNSKRAAGKCVGLKLFIQKVANVCKYEFIPFWAVIHALLKWSWYIIIIMQTKRTLSNITFFHDVISSYFTKYSYVFFTSIRFFFVFSFACKHFVRFDFDVGEWV